MAESKMEEAIRLGQEDLCQKRAAWRRALLEHLAEQAQLNVTMDRWAADLIRFHKGKHLSYWKGASEQEESDANEAKIKCEKLYKELADAATQLQKAVDAVNAMND